MMPALTDIDAGRLIRELMEAPVDTTTERLILVALGCHIGEGTRAVPVATLARYASCDPRTARRALRALEARGQIRRTANSGDVTEYDITFGGWAAQVAA